jgi:hypothetical protein
VITYSVLYQILDKPVQHNQRFIYPSRSLAFLILPNPLPILADVFEADPILILADTPIDPGLAEKGARLGWDR